ncbi:EamA family transporter [Bacillus thuringiensis]|nr:EamA family transporter [Bacillus thuringiensis]
MSVLVFLDPTVAILLDTVFTGFRPTSMQVVGIILIFVGMALTFRKGREGELSVERNATSEI